MRTIDIWNGMSPDNQHRGMIVAAVCACFCTQCSMNIRVYICMYVCICDDQIAACHPDRLLDALMCAEMNGNKMPLCCEMDFI